MTNSPGKERAYALAREAFQSYARALDPFIQASGFHGTATVRHLAVAPITVNAGSATVDVSWDMRDDAGKSVGADDYSLVFNVVDDAGRTSIVGATLQVR